MGAGIGLVSGALICGGLAYLLTPEPKPPPPAPKVERTIIFDDVLFDFDKSVIKPEASQILDRW
jgi:outer membrane protein OmpA-like peptidoglycan-associated protein